MGRQDNFAVNILNLTAITVEVAEKMRFGGHGPLMH